MRMQPSIHATTWIDLSRGVDLLTNQIRPTGYSCLLAEPWKGRSVNSIRRRPQGHAHGTEIATTTLLPLVGVWWTTVYGFPTFFFQSPVQCKNYKSPNSVIPPKNFKKKFHGSVPLLLVSWSLRSIIWWEFSNFFLFN